LRARLDGRGSPLYVLTWKRWDIGSGPPICALRASARPTSGSGSIGWPTALARDARSPGARAPGVGQCLGIAARLAGWCSPTAQDHSRGGLPPRPTDTGVPLSQQVAGIGPARIMADGRLLTGSAAGMDSGGLLRAGHSRWLMGYPPAWDHCAPGWHESDCLRRWYVEHCGSWARTLRALARIVLARCAATATPSFRR